MEQENMWKYTKPDTMKFNEYKNKDNTYPWECIDNCYNEKQNYNNYTGQHIPIQNMGSKIYAYVYQSTLMSLGKFMPNMTQMPKAISKDKFNIIVNDCMCTLTKDEKKIKDMMKSRSSGYDENDRVFCPYCGGMLKSIVEVALITSLMQGGCAFCF